MSTIEFEPFTRKPFQPVPYSSARSKSWKVFQTQRSCSLYFSTPFRPDAMRLLRRAGKHRLSVHVSTARAGHRIDGNTSVRTLRGACQGIR
jgi:hypothetical protein